MKKFFRLLCAIVGCLCMLMNTVLASSTSEIGNRLAQISQLKEYKPGASTFGANGCWVFVDSVSRLLYGINIPNLPNGYLLEGAKGYWSCIDYAYNNSATNEGVAKVLKKAQAGDIIQYRCDWATWQHTAMIYSNNGNTVTLYDFANFKVLKRDVALNNLPGTMGNFGGIAGYGITLYRCNHDISTVPIKVSESTNNSGGGQGIFIIATTKGADTITETSAILRGEVSSSGGKITECGMYIGTSKNNLTLLGSDKVLSTYGTPCYYSTSKYGYTLQPGTTYYYQVYAKVGTETKKGEVKSFKTISTPTPEPTAETYRARIDTSGEQVGSRTKYCTYSINMSTWETEITEVRVYDNDGKTVASLKPDTLVTVDPNKNLSVKGTKDKLVYVEFDSGNGYVWDAYLSTNLETSTPPPSATKYQARINVSEELMAKKKYSNCVIDERTGKILEFSAVAYYDDSGKVSATLKPGTVITVNPNKAILGKDEEDLLLYVESDSGNGYVWDAYISTVPETSTPTPPKTPKLQLSSKAANQGGTVTVSWEMEPGVEYDLHYSDPKNTLKKGAISVRSYGVILGANSPYAFSDLYPGEHRVYVTASNEYGSVDSEEVSFTVK